MRLIIYQTTVEQSENENLGQEKPVSLKEN